MNLNPAFEKAAGVCLAQLAKFDAATLKAGADYSRKTPGAYEAVFSDARGREIHIPAELLPELAARAQGPLKAAIGSAVQAVKGCEEAVAAGKERKLLVSEARQAREKRIADAISRLKIELRGMDYPEPKNLGYK